MSILPAVSLHATPWPVDPAGEEAEGTGKNAPATHYANRPQPVEQSFMPPCGA